MTVEPQRSYLGKIAIQLRQQRFCDDLNLAGSFDCMVVYPPRHRVPNDDCS